MWQQKSSVIVCLIEVGAILWPGHTVQQSSGRQPRLSQTACQQSCQCQAALCGSVCASSGVFDTVETH